MDLIDSLRERVKKRLMERANAAVNAMGQVRFRPPGKVAAGKNGADEIMVPASSLEEIAILHSIHQAEAQVLTEMILAVDEEYRLVMGQPKQPVDPATEEARARASKKREEGVYG